MPSPDRARAPRARSTLDVLDVIRQRLAVTQPELVAATKLSRNTVAAVVRHLRERELIELAPAHATHGGNGDGRPPAPIRFRSDAASAVCVDLGNRHVTVGVGGLDGLIQHSQTKTYAHDLTATEALEAAATLLAEGASSTRPLDVVGVCVSIGAPVDQIRGRVAPGPSAWIGMAPAAELQYRLGDPWSDIPFTLSNNANLDILAEHKNGAIRGHLAGEQHNALLVRWGNGIGGAALVDGKLLIGTRGIATEIGHTPLHRPRENGLPCPWCGHHCLDSVASGNALTSALARATGKSLSFDKLIERAVSSPGVERDLLRVAAERIGEVVATYASFLNAQLVVVSGRHFGDAPHDLKAYTLIVDAVRTGMQREAFPPALEDVAVVLGERGRLSAIEGGLVSVLRQQLPTFFEQKAGVMT
ncbi:MAG: ROK family transcriptional regulator [Solirubrobacteraceae bacterium]